MSDAPTGRPTIARALARAIRANLEHDEWKRLKEVAAAMADLVEASGTDLKTAMEIFNAPETRFDGVLIERVPVERDPVPRPAMPIRPRGGMSQGATIFGEGQGVGVAVESVGRCRMCNGVVYPVHVGGVLDKSLVQHEQASLVQTVDGQAKWACVEASAAGRVSLEHVDLFKWARAMYEFAAFEPKPEVGHQG